MTPMQLVRQMHLDLWGRGDRSAIDRYISPDARTLVTGFDGSTVDVLREDVDRYLGAFVEVEAEIVDLIAQDDQVMLWWRTTGTHTGPYGDIAPEPTGERIMMEGVDLYRVREDLIVEARSFWDAAAVYRQFGLLADGL